MDQDNLSKWVEVYRHNYNEAGIDASVYSDEEILRLAKAAVAQQVVDQIGIDREWVFDLWWNAMLTMKPSQILNEDGESMIDMEVFKEKVKKFRN